MKNKMGFRFFALILSLVIAITAGSVIGYAESAEDDLYQDIDKVAAESGNDYFVKYRDNYELDTEEMSFFKDTSSVILNILNAFLFSLQKNIATVVINIFAFSLSTNITEILAEYLQPFVDAMHEGLWGNLAVYAIAFAAFVLLIKLAQNRTAQALSSFLALVMIITMAFLFYAYPVELFEGIELVADGVSDEVLEGPYNAVAGGGNADDAKGKASALCWDIFVHKPWQILEFGTVETAEKYELEILKYEPGSENRLKQVEKLADSENLFSKSVSHQMARLVTVSILFIFNLILMLLILAFSLLILGYKILLLFYMLLGIFIFLIALLPSFGAEIIRRWSTRTIGVAFTRVLITFFLAVILIFMDVIYSFVEEYGLVTVLLLMIVSIAAVWFERYRLVDLFAGYRSTSEQLPQSLRKSLNVDMNAIDTVQTLRYKALSSNPSRTSENEDDTDKTSGYGIAGNYVRGNGNTLEERGNRNSANYSSDIRQSAEAMNVSADRLRTATDDMSSYFRHAEELLQKQYDYSKAKADEAAERENKPAEYDDFVKRTDKIRLKGNGQFDNRDVSNVARIMKRTVEQGGSVQDVVTDGMSIYRRNRDIQRPQSLDYANSQTIRIQEKVPTPVKQQKGLEYFRGNFGEEKGEEIFEKLSQKYGTDVLREYSPDAAESSKTAGNSRKMSYAQVMKQIQKQQQERSNKQAQNQAETQKIRNGDD